MSTLALGNCFDSDTDHFYPHHTHDHLLTKSWHSMAQHGRARHGTARHGTARHGTARHGTERHSLNYVYTVQKDTEEHSVGSKDVENTSVSIGEKKVDD